MGSPHVDAQPALLRTQSGCIAPREERVPDGDQTIAIDIRGGRFPAIVRPCTGTRLSDATLPGGIYVERMIDSYGVSGILHKRRCDREFERPLNR